MFLQRQREHTWHTSLQPAPGDLDQVPLHVAARALAAEDAVGADLHVTGTDLYIMCLLIKTWIKFEILRVVWTWTIYLSEQESGTFIVHNNPICILL